MGKQSAHNYYLLTATALSVHVLSFGSQALGLREHAFPPNTTVCCLWSNAQQCPLSLFFPIKPSCKSPTSLNHRSTFTTSAETSSSPTLHHLINPTFATASHPITTTTPSQILQQMDSLTPISLSDMFGGDEFPEIVAFPESVQLSSEDLFAGEGVPVDSERSGSFLTTYCVIS